jgi:pimeloyl-ACP methyl ester carboxylesterase
VHGALGDARQWAPIGDRLASHFTVLSVSRRFHHPNAPPHPNAVYTYELHRDDLLQSLESSIGPKPAHLVGHSWGAGVALLATLQAPSAVRSLTLIEPALGSVVSPAAPGFEPEAASRREMVAATQTFVRARQDDRAAEVLFDWLQGGVGGFAALAGPVKDGLLDNAATIGPTFAVAPPDLTCAQLQALRVPTLVLTGALTRVWFKLIGEACKACIPGAEAGIIPGARHMTIVENPEATASLLLEFLSRH